MATSDRQALVHAALDAQRRAYCPYSGFAVGAALRTASSRVFSGANVENASFGLTICAERVAAANAVAAGEREFLEIAVASAGGASPCGACRQFLAEFHPSLPVTLVDSLQAKVVGEFSLGELLPNRFEGPE